VNAICETAPNELWLGTARGLLAVDKIADTSYLYTIKDGLPNDFINGILPEGDSCLWISTDNGLCRLSFRTASAVNFFVEDGLTANEFNRTSYFRSRSGKLYFGGLNGVNVLLPSTHYLEHSLHQRTAPLVLSGISYFDGQRDSMLEQSMIHLRTIKTIKLSHRDRMFNIHVALLDFRRPEEHQFQFYLEGYENDWSEVSNEPIARYTDLEPGDYVLHVRARTSAEEWNPEELRVPISIRPAIYQQAWFLPVLILLGVGLIGGIMQYRLHLLQKRRSELENEVALRTRELAEEKQKSEELLLNILPAGLAEELKQNGFAKAKRHERVSVMFSDFKGFTKISEQLEPEELVAEIDHCFRAFDEITERHGLEKIKTIGDAYLLVGGISEKAEDQAKRVVLAALEIQEFMSAIAVERKLNGEHFFEARIGIHTGPLVAGIVGIKKFAYDIWGDTVNVASRMETNGVVGRVNLSGRTYELVREDFRCTHNGRYSENNADVEMYLVEEYLGPRIKSRKQIKST
jgi:class 3 adenylate cyclase